MEELFPINSKYLENKQNMQYNNESEVGINGGISRYNEDDRRGVRRLFTNQEGISNDTRNSQELYRNQEEQSKLSNQQRKLKIIDYAEKNRKQTFNSIEVQINSIAQKLGADVIFYDKNDNNYSGFTKDNKIYVNTASEERTETIFVHEFYNRKL